MIEEECSNSMIHKSPMNARMCALKKCCKKRDMSGFSVFINNKEMKSKYCLRFKCMLISLPRRYYDKLF